MTGNNKHIAIIGAGAAGSACAYFLLKFGLDVTIFDKGSLLRTLLPTGGGRCNLAHAEFDFKELAKNYPRGEKFLYSVFSRFSTSDTIEFFNEIGVPTYIQEDGRIFPECNSAKTVREHISKHISKNFVQEEVLSIDKIEDGFKVETSHAKYLFSHVILATGGHSGYEIAKKLGLKIVAPKPSLVGLNTRENFKELSGTVVQNCYADGHEGALLFTHFGVSGPLIYKISSTRAFENFPYKIGLDLCPKLTDFQEILNTNPHKEIKNILSNYLPQKAVRYILKDFNETEKGHNIDGRTRDLLLRRIHTFEVEITGTNRGEETVTAGGIDLDEINPKTMETKKVPNLYCIGELLNIDGFCGGFNLQNAWSTAFVCAKSFT